MALHLLRHPSLSPPALLFLNSSNSYPTPSFLPSSLSFLPLFSYQQKKRTLLKQQCTANASSSPEESLETVISEQEEEDSVEKSAEPKRRLIAQNIPWTSTSEEIKTLFERHGTVLDVQLSMHDNIRNRGLAFITMASEEEALLALSNLNSHDLNGRVIKVEFARPLKKKPIQPTTSSPPTTTFNIFVGNLAWSVRSRDLRALFGTTGNLISADVVFHSNPRRSTGYGFVSYATKEEADAAIAALNEKRLMGRKIRLVLGKPQTDNSERKSFNEELPFEASTVSIP